MTNPIHFTVKQPESPHLDNNNDILFLGGIKTKRDKWDTYTFGDIPVPRVSDILKECLGKDYLMKWAANLGDRYQKESAYTLYIGTLVHELIEYFFYYGKKKEIDYVSYNVKYGVEKAYNNFITWYNDKIARGYKINVLMTEKGTTNPWFGGTIDAIMRLEYNGVVKTYIVDFKTSKQISIDYIIQTYAYYWSENWNATYNGDTTVPRLDGIAVIRVDKVKDKYEDLFIDFNDPINFRYRNDIDFALGSIINWFYHIHNLQYDLKLMKIVNKKHEGGF